MRTIQTTALGFAAFLSADAFRWGDGHNGPVETREREARRHALWCYFDISRAAHKPLTFGPGDLESATLAAIECFAQMHVSGPPTRRTA